MHPHNQCTLRISPRFESSDSLHHSKPHEMLRKCMYGGDNHLALKHLVSLEACRSLSIVGGYDRSY